MKFMINCKSARVSCLYFCTLRRRRCCCCRCPLAMMLVFFVGSLARDQRCGNPLVIAGSSFIIVQALGRLGPLSRLVVVSQDCHEISYGQLRRDCPLTSIVRGRHKERSRQQHVECLAYKVSTGTASRHHDGNMLHVSTHEQVELQNICFQRDSSKELQCVGMQLCDVLGRVSNEQPSRQRNPKDVRMHWIVRELVFDVPKETVPKGAQTNADTDLRSRNNVLMRRGRRRRVVKLRRLLDVRPQKAGENAKPHRVLVGLESKKDFFRKDFEKVDGRCFVKQNVCCQTNGNGRRVAMQGIFDFTLEHMSHIGRRHGDKESRRVEWNDVKVVQLGTDDEA